MHDAAYDEQIGAGDGNSGLDDGRCFHVLNQRDQGTCHGDDRDPTRTQMPAKVRAIIDFLVEKREAIAASRVRASAVPGR